MTTAKTPRLDALLAAANPIQAEEAVAWAWSPAADRVLRAAMHRPPVSSRMSLRRLLAATAASVVLLLAATGAVIAAVRIIGGPAPANVRHDISNVDQGMPADLRYHPDVRNARLVAVAGSSSLYAADLPDGGFCSELVVAGRAAGAVCVTAASLRAHPVQVTVPLPASAGTAPLITIGGRIALRGAASVEVRYADAGTDRAKLESGYYVLEVAAAHRASAFAAAFTVVVLDSASRVLGSVSVPAAADTPPPPAPIEATTISDSSDFTLVLGVDGRVYAVGATALALQFPDGHEIAVPLQSDGSFHMELPKDLQRAFALRPGALIARDAAGHVVATTGIESVAAARAAGM